MRHRAPAQSETWSGPAPGRSARPQVRARKNLPEGTPQMEIDPRGPRFGALITTVVFAVVLITSTAGLLAAQALVFAVGTVFGLRYAPYGLIYRALIRPRLGPPKELEAEAPPRFAQGV